ncbi:uncharacterized protein LOC126628654 isoform X3 [Malus sylvestris]|uniref:uncharacterized protein LOC126628654 isoform X3 n=1 Tax=Malus sylvestris TaxID=3752 RepID=UPI0021AC1A2D|nr:uncharacterized protein LOC126628654 isoform X3 [Malus sylvestris]
MEVFYPLVDVHPITRTLDKPWDADRSNKDHLFADKKPPSSLMFPWPGRIFSFLEEMNAQRRSSSFELMTYSRRCLRYQIQLLLHHPRVKTHPSPFQKLGVVRFYRELSPHQTSTTERPWQWVCRKQIKQQLKADKR